MVSNRSHVLFPTSHQRARGPALPLTVLLGIGIALAAPGDLDPGFGDGGLVSLMFSDFGGSSAMAVLQQPDGKLVVAGLGDVFLANDDDWIVLRLGADGQLDSSFGSDGVSTADYSNYFDSAHDVIRQEDGQLILAGTVGVSETESDFALARFGANGSLDTTFGTGGWATVDLGGSDERAFGLIQQPGGELVIAGYTNAGGTHRTTFVRFNPDGTLDTTFGTGGSTLLDFGGELQFVAYAFAQQPDGKLVVAGTAFLEGGAVDIGIARLTAKGVLDTSFDGDGMVTIDVGGGDEQAFAVAIQSDFAIAAAGYVAAVGGDHINGLLVRVDGNGRPDPAFGTNGAAVVDLGTETIFYSMIVPADDSLITTGYRLSSEFYPDMILARFHANGTRDGGFGFDGVATADFGKDDMAAASWGNAIVRQIDGKHAVAGYNFNQGAFVVARFDNDATSAGRIGLAATYRSANETDGTVTYTVRRTGGRSGAVSVGYATVARSALAGSDFEAASGTLTWSDGEVDDRTITINLIDDAEAEPGEDFSLNLSAPTGGARLAASTATTGITSLDGPGRVGLLIPGTLVRVGESDRIVEVYVYRSQGSAGAVGVDFELEGGTASPDVDYAPATGTVTWADGEIGIKAIEVEIFDDAETEGEETIPVRLRNPTGGARLHGALTSIAIRDNEAGFGLVNARPSVQESDGSVLLTVFRSGDSNSAASVDYATSSGSAAAGSDFTGASGTLEWAAGETSDKTISVNITNDGADEADETFAVALSNPSAGTLGSNSTATVTIVDNDATGGGGGGVGSGGNNGGGGGGAFDWLFVLLLTCRALGSQICERFSARQA